MGPGPTRLQYRPRVTELVLGPILRHVSETSATIWVETDGACDVAVLDHHARTFCVQGHHYALVIVTGLEPATRHDYDVRIDGRVVWPLDGDTLPAPTIRTYGAGDPVIVFGSCRAAAPHEPPYTLELDHDPRGRGIDALHALGLRMIEQDPDEWPDLLVMLGDQIYADNPSPRTRRRLRRTKRDEVPDDVVGGFEQYTWLYQEAWTPQIERWVLSAVPSTMIFDDHDMIDDWNISDRWVREIRQESWWEDHIIGGLMSYWIYQHLGNLSPERIEEEGLLADLHRHDDASDVLRRWAMRSEEFTPVPGGYHFSYRRELGDVRLIVIDNRNGRELDPDDRRMVGDDEWGWISRWATEPCRHLVLATSLPVLVPGGLHDLQSWNESVCRGAWGRPAARLGEWMRRAIDLEDWAAFDRSFRDLCELLAIVGTATDDREAPATITMLAGDIHFAYVAESHFPDRPAVTSRITQVVASPLRNALVTRERRVIRFGLSRFGRSIGKLLRRSVRGRPTPLAWELTDGPIFANNIGTLRFDGDVHLVLERTRADDDGKPTLVRAVERHL
jgi:hypothetical protein